MVGVPAGSAQPQPKFEDPLREALDPRKDRRLRSRPTGAKQVTALAGGRSRLSSSAPLDLTGLRPSYEEVQTFVADRDPKAYEKLMDRFWPLRAMASGGDATGWMWSASAKIIPPRKPPIPPILCLAVSRLGDQAINKDLPYDRFVKLQLAADLMQARRATIFARSVTRRHADLSHRSASVQRSHGDHLH